MILLLSQVSLVGKLGTNPDYLVQIGPPAIIIEVFPRKESNEPCFLSFTAKHYYQTVKR